MMALLLAAAVVHRTTAVAETLTSTSITQKSSMPMEVATMVPVLATVAVVATSSTTNPAKTTTATLCSASLLRQARQARKASHRQRCRVSVSGLPSLLLSFSLSDSTWSTT